MDVSEYGEDKSNIDALRWDFYKKYQGGVIKREFFFRYTSEWGENYLDLCEG